MVDFEILKYSIKEQKSLYSTLKKLAINSHYYFLKIVFFIDSKTNSNFIETCGVIQELLKETNILNKEFKPLTSIIAQQPLDGSFVDIEIFTLNKKNDCVVQFKSLNDNKYCIVETKSVKYLFFTTKPSFNIVTNSEILYNTVFKAYENTSEILSYENMSFVDIVRQWAYIENVLKLEEFENGTKQHYQIFNDIRSHFHTNHVFENGLMSATGVGTSAGCFSLDIIGILPKNKEIKIDSITNPDQIDAFNYSLPKLLGTPLQITKSLRTPKFSRGKILFTNKNKLLFISGTSSVIGENSVAVGNTLLQLKITLENIDKLIKQQNFSKYNDIELNDDHVISLRVYLKDKVAFSQVEEICKSKYTNAKIIYIFAEICRQDLNIEIEAIVKS